MSTIVIVAVVVAVGIAIAALISASGLAARLARLELTNGLLMGQVQHLDQLYRALLLQRRDTVAPARPAPEFESDREQAPAGAPTTTPPETVAVADERGYSAPTHQPMPPSEVAPGVLAVQPRQAQSRPFNWERLLGVTLPIWFGAIALSFAGFFFVRFAVETGFFTPELRVIAGVLLALAFLAAAQWVRHRGIANGPAIAAALAAAAMATLYADAYAASVLFGLIPQNAGFLAMAAVAFASIGIALVYGQAVAVVGFLGGYAAPLFFPSDSPSALVLFAYLAAVLLAAFAAIRRQKWWHLSVPALAGPLLWLLLWSGAAEPGANPVSPSIFVLLVAAIPTLASYRAWAADRRASWPFAKRKRGAGAQGAAAWGFATASLGSLALLFGSGFAVPFWTGHVLLAAFAVGLAVAFPLGMRFIVFLPAAASTIGLLAWASDDFSAGAVVTGALAALYGFAAFDKFRRLREPGFWATASAATVVGFYCLFLFQVAGWGAVLENRHLWAAGALLLAAGMLALLANYGPRVPEARRQRSIVYAAFGAAITALISLVAVIELDPVLFPAAAALQVLGLAALHRRRPLRGLRVLATILALLFAILVLGAWSGIALLDRTGLSFVFARSVADAPLVLLILPGLAFLAAGTLFTDPTHDPANDVASARRPLADGLHLGGLAMLALGLYYALVPPIGPFVGTDSHIAGAWVIGPELALALLAFLLARWQAHVALARGAMILAIVVAAVLMLGLVVPVYTFWPRVELQGVAVLNTAVLSLAVPGLLLVGLGLLLRQYTSPRLEFAGRGLAIVGILSLFTYVLVAIRHAFHPDLLQGVTSSPEYYAYSAATLGFGLALLVIGVALRDLGARMLSLVFVVIATFKVFLFDASALEGLLRVISFLGMGLAFLAISWFYARFVFGFGRARPPETGTAAPA